MGDAIFFMLVGYLSGSLLFARLCARLLSKPAILTASRDGNPGAANAFLYGGFGAGCITLIGDILKGFFPVFLFFSVFGLSSVHPVLSALVLFAPVLGHAFPFWSHFQGGKGIAVTFGCLLGLFPNIEPLGVFALLFVFFSVVLCITPHFSRTVITYLATLVSLLWLRCDGAIALGFSLITATVLLRMYLCPEHREPMRVKLLWMR